MRSWMRIALWLILTPALLAQPTPKPLDGTARLPVKRVILYKNGVGYFEHAGRVNGSGNVNIDFTTAQLNDVLKSLTVLDLGKGHITGVTYNSIDPLNKRLGTLRLPVGADTTTAQFLEAIRGAQIDVRSGASSASGRLLNVEQRELLGKDDQKITVDELSLVSETGEVRRFDLTPATSVRIAEKDLNEEVGRYLHLLASSRDQDVRRLTISAAGSGERDLLVSYISEVPIWKSTYRIVVPKEGKPLLQGWAIVDNTVGEDWNNVELSLVAGAPQSFVQQLSQPYYARRPVVPLPESAMITPQTYEAALTEQNQEASAPPGAPATPMVANGGPVGVGDGQAGGIIGGLVTQSGRNALVGSGGGVGVGAGRGTGSGVFHVGGVPLSGQADRLTQFYKLQTPQNGTAEVARSQELGDLFEYQLKDRVTIRKNQSALVPILQSRVDAEKVSVWNPSSNYVLRALWIDNTSGLTLDGGSFNVLEDDAFAGEGLMDPIKPGEKRLLSYAADLGVLVDEKQKNENQQVTKVAIKRGVMTHTSEERQERTYTVRNRDTAPRTVIIEHPLRDGWKLGDGIEPVESSASCHRFRVTIEPKKTATLTVKEYHPLFARYELTNLNDDQVAYFISQKMINGEVEEALRKVIAQKNDIAATDGEIGSRQGQITSISEDQQRVRENMKALKGSAEEKSLVERYARQLNQQEDQVASLRTQISDLQRKRNQAQKALEEMIQGLSLEEKI
jgi:Domain of unknown function (DUF4139)